MTLKCLKIKKKLNNNFVFAIIVFIERILSHVKCYLKKTTIYKYI